MPAVRVANRDEMTPAVRAWFQPQFDEFKVWFDLPNPRLDDDDKEFLADAANVFSVIDEKT